MEVEYIRISAETLHIFNFFNFQPLSLILVSRSAIFNSEFSTFKTKPSILFRLPIFVTLLVSFIIVISKFVLTMLSQEKKAKKLSRGKA